MELISLPPTVKNCYNCEKSGYYVENGGGGEYYYCPICSHPIHHDNYYYHINNKEYEISLLDIGYCDKCKIPFKSGCTHGENGCTDDVTHAMFIKRFTFNGVVYDGIPKFETYEECRSQIDGVVYKDSLDLKLSALGLEISEEEESPSPINKVDCEWYCTCDGNSYDCKKAFYVRQTVKCKYWGKTP